MYLYENFNYTNYKKCSLPPDAPANPENEDKVIAPVQKKRAKISAWRLDDDVDDNDEDDNAADDYFATPKGNNNPSKQKHKKRKTTINPDLVLGVECRV